MKKLIIFDLDGTLAVSKSALTSSMANLLRRLLRRTKVAVISGGSFQQFEKQLVGHLEATEAELANLFLFPTCGSTFYTRRAGKWEVVYAENLNEEEKIRIRKAFAAVLPQFKSLLPVKLFGEQLEDRASQMTFSAAGQQAPIEIKKTWDPDFKKRFAIMEKLKPLLPDLEIRTGGTTSIDVTRKGIDKAYGVRQISSHLGIPIADMIFVGDQLFPGGNDNAALSTGIEGLQVADEKEAEKRIEEILISYE